MISLNSNISLLYVDCIIQLFNANQQLIFEKMFLIIFGSLTLLLAGILAKRLFIKRLQHRYERSLLSGDKFKSNKIGKDYYLALDEATRRSKGIVNIDEKISDDFRAFNNHRVPTLL